MAHFIGIILTLLLSGSLMGLDPDCVYDSSDKAVENVRIIDNCPESGLISTSISTSPNFRTNTNLRSSGTCYKRNYSLSNFIYSSYTDSGLFPARLFSVHLHIIALRKFRN